jgi:hypothetical protein
MSKRPSLTARDLRCISFVERFGVARTSALCRLFYGGNLRVAQRRLTAIVACKALKRARYDARAEYIYYAKTPAHLAHNCALADFLAKLSTSVELLEWEPEFRCGNVRADARIRYRSDDVYDALVEIQLTGKPDLQKYFRLKRSAEWSKWFERFPKLLVVCEKECPTLGLDVVRFQP